MKESKSIKIAWNGEKIGRKQVFDFLAPPPKKFGGRTKFFVENEKNRGCSKLPEMARKLVEHDLKMKKEKKLFKIAWKGKKIGRKWFFYFLDPPP